VEQPTTHHVAGLRNPSTEISLAVRRAQIIHRHPDGITIELPRRVLDTTTTTPAPRNNPLTGGPHYR
jgi:hypothetical protein